MFPVPPDAVAEQRRRVILGVAAFANRTPTSSGGSGSRPGPAPSSLPSAPPSPAASPEPGKDPCLVGTWQQVLQQKQDTVDNVKYQFSGGAKDLRTFSVDGKFSENFNLQEPIKATVNGVQYEEWDRGVATGTYQARNGVLLYSNTAASGTIWFTRNGKRRTTMPLSFGTEPEQYICTGTTMTISASFYTSSWTKISDRVQ